MSSGQSTRRQDVIQGTFRNKVIMGAVAAAALVGGGSAIAAGQLGSEDDQQAIIDDAAEELGVEPTVLSDALEHAVAARIDAAVAAGELTQEQADALKERLEAEGVGIFGVGPPGHFHGGSHGGLRGGLDAAADYLGLTEAELHDQLESGQTLAEIATAQGKTADGLEQALLDAAKADLAAAVDAGRLTQAQADEILADLPARIDDVVNGTFPPGGPGRHGPWDGGPPPADAPSGEAPAEDGTTTAA
jgi:hypothetical protein